MNNFEHESPLPSQRQIRILSILKERKAVSVAQLARELYFNEATVRRDLNVLAKSGAVTRTYGGAVLTEGLDSEIPFFVRETSFADAKRQIGDTAAGFVRDGDAIFLDSSSTTAFLIPHLSARRGLRIVTNGAKAVLQLSKLTDCEIFCVGGKLRENSLSFIGEAAAHELENYRFDKAFFSCRGIDLTGGLTDSNAGEAEIRRILLRNSKKTFLLADSSKFGAVSFCAVCPVEAVGNIVTDAQPDPTWSDFFRAKGIAVYR